MAVRTVLAVAVRMGLVGMVLASRIVAVEEGCRSSLRLRAGRRPLGRRRNGLGLGRRVGGLRGLCRPLLVVSVGGETEALEVALGLLRGVEDAPEAVFCWC